VWIGFLECLLHISYCLEIKKWQARGEDDQQELEDKNKIQNLFNNKIGILANNVMPGESGTSNNRNTAGRFSKSYRQAARISGVNKNLILIFHIQ
jgi:hypothetical protein